MVFIFLEISVNLQSSRKLNLQKNYIPTHYMEYMSGGIHSDKTIKETLQIIINWVMMV